MKEFVRNMFVAEDEPYFSTAAMISPAWSSGRCVFAFFQTLRLRARVFACVRHCVLCSFFRQAEERGWSRPACDPTGPGVLRVSHQSAARGQAAGNTARWRAAGV